MAVASDSFQFGKDICKVFGLDPSRTKTITIKIVPDDIVIVDAEMILWNDTADGLITEMKKYEFKPHAKDEDITKG
jgi:hypothetical protein